jgi:hypothetical protein
MALQREQTRALLARGLDVHIAEIGAFREALP